MARRIIVLLACAGCRQVFGIAATGLESDAGDASVAPHEDELTASNPGANDKFGWSLALSTDGNTLAIGAPGESSAATGIGGSQLDDSAPNAGAVYVFTRAGGLWTQAVYVKASNTDANDGFGVSVALSSDGATLAVGAGGEASGVVGDQTDNTAAGAGAVYLFHRNNTGWAQVAYVKASNVGADDHFGTDLALSSDGAQMVVGAFNEASAGMPSDNSAPGAGAAYTFDGCPLTCAQTAYLKARVPRAGAWFGAAVATIASGKATFVGAPLDGVDPTPGAGDVFLFSQAMMSVMETAPNADANDHYGASVASSATGTVIAVGATQESSAATGAGGTQSDNSAPNSGAVYVYTAVQIGQVTYIKATVTDPGAAFGKFLSLSNDGTVLAVGAWNSAGGTGAAYVYRSRDGSWSPVAALAPSHPTGTDSFGWPVVVSGDGATLAIGAPGDSSSRGAVYVLATP